MRRRAPSPSDTKKSEAAPQPISTAEPSSLATSVATSQATVQAPSQPRPKGARKFPRRPPDSETAPGFGVPAVTHGYFKTRDGTKLFYSSEGKGKPLVFCYGLVCSSLHWTYQIEHFQRNYRCIWFDYRGHQNSEKPRDFASLTLECVADDLRELLDELRVEDAVLLGHSMGVNVVLEFAKLYPKRVRGMVLGNGTARNPMASFAGMQALESGFRFLREVHRRAPWLVERLWKLQLNTPLVRSLVALNGFNPHLTPREDIELYVRQVAAMDPAIFLQLLDSYRSYDATRWLHRIEAPTLVFGGEKDAVVPFAQQELMHQLIPGSELELIRHGSHCPQMDLPELLNLRIEKFLTGFAYR
jgi:pimeloyl-ACP methyl ester carboxylesterase